MTINVMTQAKFDKAKQFLIDNGIDIDECETVLQALCYILLDEETEQFFTDVKIGSFSFADARKDVIQYLSAQDEDYFTGRGYTKQVLSDKIIIDSIIFDHYHNVCFFGWDRKWSCENSCNNILLSLC